MTSSRFESLDVSVEEFIDDQENENTKKKTKQNVGLLEEFLGFKEERRKIEEIPPQELNVYLSEFIITVRTKDNQEYEPSSLRSLIASFERHLKKKNYGFSIMKDLQFEQARKALQSKQKDLKRKGKGNKPNASAPLNEDDIKVLYEKKLLGTETPDALLNTIWFNNTVHFGLRGCKEHRDMCWGDVKLCKNSTGQEYLEFHERQTKTRTGNNPRDVRPIIPKMFSVPSSEKCPVLAYKLYAEKRPAEMKCEDAPFYLAVNNVVKSDSRKPWFKKSPVGVNKLNSLMKNMSEKAGLGPKLKNHSGRKTMIQTLVNSEIPPTDIIQLSGHKNLQSITNYSTVSEKQQMHMSRKLSALTTGTTESSYVSQETTQENPETSTMLIHRTSENKQAGQQALSLFTGATISGGQITVSINTLNQSPTLTVRETPKPKRYKRIRALDSDSD